MRRLQITVKVLVEYFKCVIADFHALSRACAESDHSLMQTIGRCHFALCAHLAINFFDQRSIDLLKCQEALDNGLILHEIG